MRTERNGLADVVCHQNHAAWMPAAERRQEILHARAQKRVKSREGLVHEENLRLHNERAAERKTLPLSSRKLGGKARLEPRESEFGKHGRDTPGRIGAASGGKLQWKREVLPHALPRKKTEMLPDEACAHILNRTDSALRRGPPDRPRNRRPQPRESGEKRRLPATGLADDGKRGPRRQRQIQPLNDGPAVVAKRKPVAGQSRRLKRLFPLILHAHLRITDGSPRCRKRAPP